MGNRQWALRALGIPKEYYGDYAGSVRSALAAALRDTSDLDSAAAATALVRFGDVADEVVPTLVRLLRSPDPKVRASAARALAKIGPGAKAAIPALRIAARDANWMVHFLSNQALLNVGPPVEDIELQLPRAACDLQRGSLSRRLRAAFMLGRMGRAGVSLLRDALYDSHPAVRQMAVQSLRVIGGPAESAAHRLAAVLRNAGEVEDVRCLVPEALCAVAPNDRATIQAIMDASRLSQQYRVQWEATRALWMLNPATVHSQTDGQHIAHILSTPCSSALIIEARTDARGRVTEAKVLRRPECQQPWPELEDAYLEAVRRERDWRTVVSGKREPMVITVGMNVQLPW
ncbi:MAG: HEAT repeat domain-containing protein [Acidobacteriota bacterium]